MYQNFERDRELVQPENFFTLSYEDLAARPFEAVQEIYEDLQLGEFAMVEPALRERRKNHRDYQPNQHQMDDQVMAEVAAAWPEYAERYGYVDSPTS